ncbi:MAG: vanadium-dependent haloperoxidase [Bacteroidota bacterium]
MKRLKHIVLGFCSLFILSQCAEPINENYAEEANDAAYLHRSVKQLTNVIVHDIFSPPVASRIYAYPSIAAYEILRHDHPNYRSLEGQLTGLSGLPQPEIDQEYCFPLASVHAFLTIGKALIFSEPKIEAFEQEVYAEFEAMQMPSAVYERSMSYGQAMSQAILAWADKDNYKQTRTFPKYSINDEEGRWKPTPPDYMDGIEPHWREIRPFVLDSAEQFTPLPPTPFDMDKNSKFYEELMEVYTALETDTEERLAIAEFWDCNPYVSHHKGHVMFATKKITPGGHWMGIAKIAALKNEADMMKTVYTYAKTAIALADGFISCWDEKYRSNLIRPETVINTHIDENWTPILQTPPFPEYTSGHSVISRAAAVTLTSIYGDDYNFVDSTEVEYGLPIREYGSFFEASEEAAVSRLYGGIHYRPAIDEGVKQGQQVGEFVVRKLQMKKEQVSLRDE